jgi:hypothetical protein
MPLKPTFLLASRTQIAREPTLQFSRFGFGPDRYRFTARLSLCYAFEKSELFEVGLQKINFRDA